MKVKRSMLLFVAIISIATPASSEQRWWLDQTVTLPSILFETCRTKTWPHLTETEILAELGIKKWSFSRNDDVSCEDEEVADFTDKKKN